MVPLARAGESGTRTNQATGLERGNRKRCADRLEGVQAEATGFILNRELGEAQALRLSGEQMQGCWQQVRPRRKKRALLCEVFIAKQIPSRAPIRRHECQWHLKWVDRAITATADP